MTCLLLVALICRWKKAAKFRVEYKEFTKEKNNIFFGKAFAWSLEGSYEVLASNGEKGLHSNLSSSYARAV